MDDSAEIAATAGAAQAGPGDGLPGGLDIAKLAHELRTPLAAIVALAEIMRDERLGALPDQRYRGYTADIHDSAVHALAVLAGFLEPDAGRSRALPMVFAEIDVALVAASSVSALTPLAERSGVRLSLDPAPRLPNLIADRRSLKQILLNLIANAVRFTPPGGEVRVSTRYECMSALSVEVADTGDGMTAAELSRALEPTAAPGAAGCGRCGSSSRH